MSIMNFVGKLFDDAPWTPSERETYVDEVFSDLLTYRVYEPQNNLYVNDGNVGFILEVAPLVGTDMFRQLQTVITNYCPSDSTVQFMSWASPNLSSATSQWARAKTVKTSLTNRMIDGRIEHLNSLCLGDKDMIKCVPHMRRVFICGWADGNATTSTQKALVELRRNLILALGGETMCADLPPAQFLSVMSEILHARGDVIEEPLQYDDEEPLNYQLPGAGVAVGRDGLTFLNSPELSVSSATVRMVPKEWNSALGSLFWGASDRIHDSPHGPVLMSLVARCRSNQSTQKDILGKRATITHSQSTSFGKWQPNLSDKAKEYETLQGEVERGEKIFDTCTVVCAYGLGDVDEGRAALAEMSKIFRHVGVNLEVDTFLQLPIFLTALPFQASGSLMKDMTRASRIKKRKGAAVTALAPLHGEWSGFNDYRGLLMVGRQGQVFDWDNYLSSGNYNVSVVGKSGSGKSVFMQEMVASIFASGGRVLVIDDGYSFKTTCELYGGNWVGIGASGANKLNPFSMIQAGAMKDQEYRADALELVTRVIATMANLGEQREGRVGGIEEEYIQTACSEVWDAHGSEGSVTFVVEILAKAALEEPRLADVVTKLRRYAVGGIYGEIFDGPANVHTNSPFTVFELSDLKSQKDLEAVVLQVIMFLGTELMFKTDRSTRVAVLIDEAWDMLGGVGTAGFLEGVVRRARKYTGALITGTQSIMDYYNNPAAKVCLENSDWTVFLAQKPEVVDELVSTGRLSAPMGVAHSLKTLISVPGKFSELAIRGPDGWIFGRLVLDAYSLAVYSSTGATVQRLHDLRDNRGMEIGDALELMVAEGSVK